MARLRRVLTRSGIRNFVKAYYRCKRLLTSSDPDDLWYWFRELAQLQAEYPETYAKLEANWQANS